MDQLLSGLLALLVWAGGVWCQVFNAYDCSNPTDVRLLSHENCLEENTHVAVTPFYLLQENFRRNVTGHLCEVKISEVIDYCGHYSSTKATDQSSYNVGRIVEGDECRRMAIQGVLSIEGKDIKTRMNQVSYSTFFTHGSIKYTGDNIECTGQSLRLKNGEVNSNMLRQLKVEVKIQEVRVIIDRGEAMLSTGEVLGRDKIGFGFTDLQTVVWNPSDENDCNIAIITQMDLSTVDQSQYYSNQHMIALTKKEKVHNDQCRVSIWSTNIEGLYLMDLGVKNLARLSMDSINVYAHWQSQLDFLGSRIVTSAQSAYSAAVDPECLRLQFAPLHQTIQLPSHRFTRNLGDASVLFNCAPTLVKLRNVTEEGQCYVQPPVVDKKGKEWYIDPNTRVLLNAGVITSCEESSAPVLKSSSGKFFAISPTPREVFPGLEAAPKVPQQGSEEHGLYPQRVISDWLKSAYIQHIHRSLTVGYSDDGGSGTPVASMIGHLTETYNKLKEGDMMSVLLGINWDKVGARCGLATTAILAMILLYWLIEFMVKIVLVYDKKKTYWEIVQDAREFGRKKRRDRDPKDGCYEI